MPLFCMIGRDGPEGAARRPEVRPAHLEHAKPFHAALVEAGRIGDVMDLAQGHFARGIDQRLAELPRAAGVSPERRRALSQALAGAMLSMLSWWINRGMPESPDEIDELYHGMVWSGVDSTAVNRPDAE